MRPRSLIIGLLLGSLLIPQIAFADAAAGWKQRKIRKQLGVTFPNMIKAARELTAEGEDVTSAAILATILDDVDDAALQSSDVAGADWDKILDFIERLIPLILRLIEIFSQQPAPTGPAAVPIPAD
jgi:hypothetical protein